MSISESPESVAYCKETTNHQWDTFVHLCSGDIQQTSYWSNIDKTNDLKAHRFYKTTGDDIVAGCQISERKVPIMGKIGYVTKGPCFKTDDDSLYDWFANEAVSVAKKEKLIYLAISPDYKNECIVTHLKKQGFRLKPNYLPPNPTVKSTLIIDLKLSTEELLGQMKKARRKNIQKGIASPIEFVMGGRDDLATFFSLMLETCKRRNAKPIISSIETLYRMWDSLHEKESMVIHLGLVDKRPICGTIGLVSGGTYKNWLWGWTGEYSSYCVSDAIDWHTIVWAKEHGCHSYDFLHVDTICANAIASEEQVKDEIKQRIHYGSTFYKMQFGGTLVHYPNIYYYYPRKLNYIIYHIIAGYLIKLPLLHKFAVAVLSLNQR